MFPSRPFDFFYAPHNQAASNVMNMTSSILLNNLQLLFWTFFDWGRGQADQTQLRARQQLPTHRFCRL